MPKVVVPAHIVEVVRRIQSQGYSCYVVGGPVRDSILGRKVKDWDLTTSATPPQLAHIFPRHRGQTRYGTTLVGAGTETVEVTTFRTEAEYSDHRRPDVVNFTSDLAVDLSRRDFTMNAIAYDPVSGKTTDPFGGLSDITARRIRAVGRASERFEEDALRMLRAVRFAGQLGFGIERDTFDAIKRAAPTTRYLALERIGGELTKMFMAPYAAIGFTAMLDADLFEPALHISDSTNLRHGIRVIAAAHTMDAVDYAAALLHHVDRLSAQGIYEMLLSVGIGADAADAVGRRAGIALGELPRDEVARMRMVGRHGPDTFFAGLSLRRACSIDRRESTADVDALVTHIRALLKSGCPFTLRQLAINGDDLATIGIKAGPKVGRILETLLDEVIVSKTPNERRALLDRARLINAD